MVKTNFGKDVKLDLSTRERECAELKFPLNIVFNTTKRLEWTAGCRQYYGYADAETTQLIGRFTTEVLVGIQTYKMPAITLDKDTPKEAMCQMFENVNTGGVSLTVFELVTASPRASTAARTALSCPSWPFLSRWFLDNYFLGKAVLVGVPLRGLAWAFVSTVV